MADPLQGLALAPPERVSHVAFVRPTEAGVLFGTGAESGVVLIFTKAYAASAKE
jgi:hypothetical protein